MAWQWKVIPRLDGGIDYSQHPAALDDHMWTDGDGFRPAFGTAETLLAYAQVQNETWGGGAYTLMGMVQNPFDLTNSVLAVVGKATGEVKVYQIDLNGTKTEIPWSGADSSGGAQALNTGSASGAFSCTITSAFINGNVVLSVASENGTFGLLRWNGGANYTTIKDAGYADMRCEYLASFGGHLIAVGTARTQAGIRTLRISDANSTDVWFPAVSNSADSIVLDSATSGFTGVAQHGTALALFTRRDVYALNPTGGIPPFTVTLAGTIGCSDYDTGSAVPTTGGFCGQTPHGVALVTADNIYLEQAPIGSPIFRYFISRLSSDDRPFLWHPGRGHLLLPYGTDPGIGGGGDHNAIGVLGYDPIAKAWYRQGGFAAPNGHLVSCNTHTGTIQGLQYRYVVTSHGQVWAEGEQNSTYVTTATLDTKDFTVGTPPLRFEIDAIKVDWEGASGVTLSVATYARDAMQPGVGANYDMTQGIITFTTQATAIGDEAHFRVQGKYIRFRFTVSGGFARIRGFSFRFQPLSDRLT